MRSRWDKLEKAAETLSKVVNVRVEVECPAHSNEFVFAFDTKPRPCFVSIIRRETDLVPIRILIRTVLHNYMDFILSEMGEINDDDGNN